MSIDLMINPNDFTQQSITIVTWVNKKIDLPDYWALLHDVSGLALDDLETEERAASGRYGDDTCSECREDCYSGCSCWCHGLKDDDENSCV